MYNGKNQSSEELYAFNKEYKAEPQNDSYCILESFTVYDNYYKYSNSNDGIANVR